MKFVSQRALMIALVLVSTTLANCGKKAADDGASYSVDESSTGVVAGAIGGALSDSSSSGTQALYKFQTPSSRYTEIKSMFSLIPKANASTFCPTFRSTDGNCTTSGASMYLSYSDCTFNGNAEWSGVQQITMSAGSAACGTFPNPGANNALYRQYVQAAGGSVAGSITLTSDRLTATVDDSAANLGNFDAQTIAGFALNGKYGTKVTFDGSGKRSTVEVAHRLTIDDVLDHSVTGNITISNETGAQRSLSGTVTVYHNLLHVVGTSTFTDLVHENTCCLPVGGTISTTFADGQNVHAGALGDLLIGKTESLTFTGCGTGTWTKTDGTTQSVTLHRCF